MRKTIKRILKGLGALGVFLFLGASLVNVAYALDAGSYVVQVTPSYKDPETGAIEDSGNNEAIGQGMTQKLCGPKGLLEVEADGEMYLTVRYYLSQFVSDVSFEERLSGNFTQRSPKKMQVVAPVEGADNIDVKYGYTDWRFKIGNLSNVFRGKAYIDPMGRNVVYFFTVSSPSPGKGDFITSVTESTAENVAGTPQVAIKTESDQSKNSPEVQGQSDSGNSQTYSSGSQETEGGFYSEGGQENTPVKGIPKKGEKTSSSSGDTALINKEEEYGSRPEFLPGYDLSKVDVKKARALTEPILENAVGITNISDIKNFNENDGSVKEKPKSGRSMMFVLFGACGAVLAGYGIKARRKMHEED